MKKFIFIGIVGLSVGVSAKNNSNKKSSVARSAVDAILTRDYIDQNPDALRVAVEQVYGALPKDRDSFSEKELVSVGVSAAGAAARQPNPPAHSPPMQAVRGLPPFRSRRPLTASQGSGPNSQGRGSSGSGGHRKADASSDSSTLTRRGDRAIRRALRVGLLD